MDGFIEELGDLLNKHGIDSASNTPDFILAQFLNDCLNTFTGTMTTRDRWHNSINDLHDRVKGK